MPIAQREYFYPQSAFLRAWDPTTVAMYGALRKGVRRRRREALRSTMQAIAAGAPEIKRGSMARAADGQRQLHARARAARDFAVASLIGALTGLVLIVAAANLGNLVMSRAIGRVRELGVRMALGARRGRIVRQLVVESVPLVVLGTVGSLLFASMASTLIAALGALPPYLDFGLDWRTDGMAVALARSPCWWSASCRRGKSRSNI